MGLNGSKMVVLICSVLAAVITWIGFLMFNSGKTFSPWTSYVLYAAAVVVFVAGLIISYIGG